MELNQRARIGILGGSFNPIHNGHLMVAQSALEDFDLTRVLFMPCYIQPCKSPAMLAPAEHRVAMVDRAIMDNLQFELLDVEIARGGPSYTVDSVRQIRAIYPDAELFLIIGADTLAELHLWRDVYVLLELCQLALVGRPGWEFEELKAEDFKLKAPWPERLLRQISRGRMVEISSSDIRHRLAEGMSIRYLRSSGVDETYT
jgi:nicotinate-nucleotide adenylyltransferase